MNSKSFLKRFRKDIKDKREYQKALLFLFLFIFCFSIFYLILSISQISNYISYFYGLLSSICLTVFFGINNQFVFDAVSKTSSIVVSTISEPITIGFLCSGVLEFCLLASAMIASVGISIKKRLMGVLISIPVIVIFNVFRITVTSYIIVAGNLSFANLVHGFLFRIFLIAMVIGTYFVWFKEVYK
ncbi:MAG: exosortase/archaeosortase family protein [archaeon]|jgi:exosortase/archaeosortase family protein